MIKWLLSLKTKETQERRSRAFWGWLQFDSRLHHRSNATCVAILQDVSFQGKSLELVYFFSGQGIFSKKFGNMSIYSYRN